MQYVIYYPRTFGGASTIYDTKDLTKTTSERIGQYSNDTISHLTKEEMRNFTVNEELKLLNEFYQKTKELEKEYSEKIEIIKKFRKVLDES